MIQTGKWTYALQQAAGDALTSVARGRLDRDIDIMTKAGHNFRMELIPSSKLVNLLGPDGARQQVRYSNMGDFGSKAMNMINNWKLK
jgi:hypothetical protein